MSNSAPVLKLFNQFLKITGDAKSQPSCLVVNYYIIRNTLAYSGIGAKEFYEDCCQVCPVVEVSVVDELNPGGVVVEHQVVARLA